MEKMQAIKRILLIDDDPVTNMINKKIIVKNSNLMVDEYTNAREVVNLFDQWLNADPDQSPDIILLDINMPEMDGWEFLSLFEKHPVSRQKSYRIFMLTSSVDLDDVEKSKNFRSVREFISKPLTPSKLKLLII